MKSHVYVMFSFVAVCGRSWGQDYHILPNFHKLAKRPNFVQKNCSLVGCLGNTKINFVKNVHECYPVIRENFGLWKNYAVQ